MNATLRPLKPEDLFHLKMGNQLHLAPGGLEIAWVVHRVDPKDNCYYSNIWITSCEHGLSRSFTQGNQRDTLPRFSPDGRSLAFLSNRLKSWQVFEISRSGGEAEALTSLPAGSISGLTYSPDGRFLAFSFHEAKAVEDGGGYVVPPDMKIPNTAPRVRYLTEFPYKEEPGSFIDAGHNQLCIFDRHSRTVTRVAPRPFNQFCPVFSPDGTTLAFYAIRREDYGFLTQGLDLWLADIASGTLTRLGERFGATIAPAWSPDGRWVATVAYRDREHSAEFHNIHVLVFPVDGGPPIVATREFDRYAQFFVATDIKPPGSGVSPVMWSADGKKLRFVAMDRGESQVFEVDAVGGPVMALTAGQHCVIDASAQGDKIALLMGAPTMLEDLFLLDVPVESRPCPIRRLTEINRSVLETIDLGEFEEYSYCSFDGQPIQGWLNFPPGFDPNKKYPLILQIHGGPHIQAGWMFFQECYILAAQGYVVAHFNPRGSHGYGEAFAEVIYGAWGSVDYQDLMCAVDRLCQEPYIDAARLGVTGGSYGGHMTNWIVTQTDRFKAAVSHRSTSNLVSTAGTSDLGFENARNAYGAQPWEDYKKLMEMSPIIHASKVTTPIMFTQSDYDFRCPIEQAEQFYSALRYLGKVAAFCRFPEETHELSRWGRPDRRMERLYRTVQWFQKYLDE